MRIWAAAAANVVKLDPTWTAERYLSEAGGYAEKEGELFVDGARKAGHPRTIAKQLGLLRRIAACLAKISFCNPGRVQLFDVGGSCLCISHSTQIRIGHGQEGVVEGKGLFHKQ